VHRWQGLQDVPANWGRSVVTIGVFDGVHRGHRRIVARAKQIGAELRLPLVVVTFDPHPDEVIRPGSHPPLLCTPAYRAELLGRLGADAVCVLPFSYEFSQVPAEDFVKSVLVDGLHAAAVVIGENFRFGHKAAGNVALLGELGEKYDFTAEGVPLLTDHGVTVSSSRIRDLLAAGDVALAALDLGRPHRVEGVVVRGQQRGKALGFQRRAAAAHGDTGRRCLRGLAGQSGHGRHRTGTLASRDLRRHQPNLRRGGPDG